MIPLMTDEEVQSFRENNIGYQLNILALQVRDLSKDGRTLPAVKKWYSSRKEFLEEKYPGHRISYYRMGCGSMDIYIHIPRIINS